MTGDKSKTTIIERLRKRSHSHDAALMDEAANEIECLRTRAETAETDRDQLRAMLCQTKP